jgi:pyruvate/2-oxoglutarate dehydrogenase complex dihydrolipoamide acyltransferase (E2) component
VTRYALSGDGSGSHLPSEPANRDLLAIRSALVENTGGRSRVRNRAHGDASSRHAPGGNTKPIGGRLTGGNRPLPSQAGTGLLDTDATVILPRIVPPQATPPTGTPTSAPAETPEATETGTTDTGTTDTGSTDTGTADTGKAEAPAAATGAAREGDVDLAEPMRLTTPTGRPRTAPATPT